MMTQPLCDLFGKELSGGDFCLLINTTGGFGSTLNPQYYKIKFIKPNKNGRLCGIAERIDDNNHSFGSNFQFSESNCKKLIKINISEVAQTLLTLTGEISNQFKVDLTVDVDTMEV